MPGLCFNSIVNAIFFLLLVFPDITSQLEHVNKFSEHHLSSNISFQNLMISSFALLSSGGN